ncbi:Stage V sporulation protein G [Geobacillus sp. WSUCF1]|nr:Stage V sporulation protein G [Geobacillus sp. WSUCF1]
MTRTRGIHYIESHIGEKVVSKMEVTDVRLRRVNTEGRMKAIASITLDNEFVVHDIRVIDGNNGLFVAMPSKRTPDGEFRDIAHPINSARAGKSRRRSSLNITASGSWKKNLKKLALRKHMKGSLGEIHQALYFFESRIVSLKSATDSYIFNYG